MYFFRKNHQQIQKNMFSKIVPNMSKDILDGQKHRKKPENRPRITPDVVKELPATQKKIQKSQIFVFKIHKVFCGQI